MVIFNSYVKLPEGRGKLKPEKPILHGKNPWVSGENVPLNQSIENSGLVYKEW